MREIKFRAWAVASRKMFFPNSDEGWDLDNGSLRPLPNTILMQFTGLHDQHGKEIYEGDIVHSKWVDAECQEGEECTREVVYEKGAFWLVTTLDGYDTNWLEVIGNVHSDPKLLKD